MFTRILSFAVLAITLFSCKEPEEISPWIQLTFKNEGGEEIEYGNVKFVDNGSCQLYTNRTTDQAGHVVFERTEDLAAYYLSGGRFAYRSFSYNDRLDLIHETITVYPRQGYSFRIVDTVPNHRIELLQWVEQPTCVDSLNQHPRIYVDSANAWLTPIDTTIYISAFPCETLIEWEVRDAADIVVRSQSVVLDFDPTSTNYQLGPF